MAFDHLRSSLTRDNLWLYILAELATGDATPREIRDKVIKAEGFEPATITFYSVLYKLRREGLVRKSSDSFRSPYSLTERGRSELVNGSRFISEVGRKLGRAA